MMINCWLLCETQKKQVAKMNLMKTDPFQFRFKVIFTVNTQTINTQSDAVQFQLLNASHTHCPAFSLLIWSPMSTECYKKCMWRSKRLSRLSHTPSSHNTSGLNLARGFWCMTHLSSSLFQCFLSLIPVTMSSKSKISQNISALTPALLWDKEAVHFYAKDVVMKWMSS